MLLTAWITVFAGLGKKPPISTIILAAVGVLLMFIGNFMGTIKPTYMFGIRTPWMLANNEVWAKTHRVGGFTYFFGGLFTAIAAFLFTNVWKVVVLIATILFITLVPLVYSYIEFRKSEKKKQS